MNCFDSNKKFIWFQQIFICPKDILFELNKCHLIKINLLFEKKKAFQNNYFLSFNQIFFFSEAQTVINFLAIPKSVSKPFEIIPNQFKKPFASRLIKNGQKSIWLNPIYSTSIRVNLKQSELGIIQTKF